MLKYFYMKIRRFWKTQTVRKDTGCAWDADPLRHPALQRMSQRELADLPFEPHRIR